MRNILKISTLLVFVGALLSFAALTNNKSYKCMIQLKNYDENGAYVIVSLLNPDGAYQQTLYLAGDDPDWYEDLPKWWAYHTANQDENIDAITGESILTGDRKILHISLDETLIDKGYKIRFESAVEDYDYHEADAEIEFSKENIGQKVEGNGYIRYVSISEPN